LFRDAFAKAAEPGIRWAWEAVCKKGWNHKKDVFDKFYTIMVEALIKCDVLF
jgi:hypothetical protein